MKVCEGLELDFESLEHMLIVGNTPFSPAYIHGMMVGLLSLGKHQAQNAWEEFQAQDSFLGEAPAATNELLNKLFVQTTDFLEDIEKGVVLMLPTDDNPLWHRLEALADWCKGFLEGVELAELPTEALRQSSPLVREVLEDLAQIKDVSLREIDSQENEKAYIELVEFVRVGALLFHAECTSENNDHRHLLH